MCKHCYKKFLERSNKVMLFCKLLEENNDNKNEMAKLCIRQRFCDEKDEYIPYKQKEGCKNYED